VSSAACINKKSQRFDREVVAAIEAGIRCHVEQSEYMILESSFLTVPFSAPPAVTVSREAYLDRKTGGG
jgi:hypothetical protein